MAIGALVVGAAYLLLAVVAGMSGAGTSGAGTASWLWLALFFAIFTFGELFILPTGLGLFARLAPERLGATTVAAWFLTIFTGSLSAGLVGTLWSEIPPQRFFAMLAGIAAVAAILLRLLDGPVRRADPTQARYYSNLD
jgi:POT family proton-dependent oligopeptide transporter